MISEKKQLIIRLLIFLALSFIPLTIAVIVLNNALGGLLFDEKLANSPVTSLVGFIGMMTPAVASIITRVVTKEGIKDSYLRANFKGNMPYYVLALSIPLAYSLIGSLIARGIYGAPEKNEFSAVGSVAIVVMLLGSGIIGSFAGVGEELGWRGYMMPKLEKLFGTPASVIIGGVIWGLWHAPLTCSGHNFGTDYHGFPFVGIGLMCIMCTLMNCILTFVTKRTKSIYPAAILHMTNNNVNGAVYVLLVSGNVKSTEAFPLSLIPMGVFAAIMFILMLRIKKKN